MDFVHVDLKTKCVKDYLLRIFLFIYFYSVKQETGNNNNNNNNNNDDDDDNNIHAFFLQEAKPMS